MKKLTTLGIIACVGLFFAPAAGIGAGPPGGLDVNVVNEPGVSVVNDATNPVPVTVQPDGLTVNVSTVYRFVGTSADKTTGDAGGVRGMHDFCQGTYIGSRMCTTEEYWKTPVLIHTEDAWIQPTTVDTFIRTIDFTAGLRMFYVDVTGAILLSERISGLIGLTINCRQWQFPGAGGLHNGTILTEEGVFRTTPCDRVLPVSCCAPASQ